MCQRNCLIRQEDQRRRRAEESVAEIIRFNSGNLNLLALGVDDGSSNNQGGRMNQNNIQGLSVEDRRDLIKNILVSRKIVEVSKQEPPSTDDDGDLPFDANSNEETKKTTLLLADVVDVESTTKHISVEPCPICLNNYKEGEILCWSQNSNCKHCFHRDCMEEWLMAHKECPCCRHNYLSLGPEDEDQINIGDEQANSAGAENYSFPRGAQLFYLLTRLQSLADTRPNTTIRLEGVELANGRRGNLEIQRATDSSFEVGGRGLNVRVEEESDNQRLENNEGLHLDLPTALQRFMHHESGRASSNNEIDDGVNGNRQPPRLDP